MNTPKFFTTQVLITPTSQMAFGRVFVEKCLERHFSGVWGDMDEEDRVTNDECLKEGGRILSTYQSEYAPSVVIWVCTEADRSVTTVLIPSEY